MVISVDESKYLILSIRDLTLKVDRIHSDISRLAQQKIPDRFVPLQEATRYLHCGRDWLVAQIKAEVLRPGIDFMDRTSGASSRKRYLVNPVSALRWLNGSQPVRVRVKSDCTSTPASRASASDPSLE
jgi:hypothetical protein